MSEVVVWQGAFDHPRRRALPCRVVVRDEDVVPEMNWGDGWQRGGEPRDATTIMQAALRDMALMRVSEEAVPAGADAVSVGVRAGAAPSLSWRLGGQWYRSLRPHEAEVMLAEVLKEPSR